MEKLSRTKKKHGAENLQKLGESLAQLPEIEINKMDIPEPLKNAVLFAQTMKKHGAKRRQLQYIGSLMRNLDPAPIADALEHISRGRAIAERKFKEMEQWRDDLINESASNATSNTNSNATSNTNSESTSNTNSGSTIASFMEQYPEADRQRLGQLVRNARKSSTQQQRGHTANSSNKMSESARKLFRYVRQIIEHHHDS